MTIRDIAVAFGFEVDKGSESQAKSSIEGIKNLATKLLGGIAVVFSVQQLSSFASDCVQAASDVQEMRNKFDVVFQGINDEVEEWATNFAESVGRNKNTIKGYLADQQNLLVGFGMTREEGAKLSEEMTSLALDLASFANMDETMAVNNMTKAVMGETEAARALGAVLNDSTRAEAMAAMGLSGKYDKLDQLTKMQVNYNAILKQSPDAVGDCIRSMDSYEAAQRRQKAATDEFKESIGGQLIPIYTAWTNLQTKGIKLATGLAKAILGDTEENNKLLHAFERIHALVKKLQPAMERLGSAVKTAVTQSMTVWKSFASAVSSVGGNAFNALISGVKNAVDVVTRIAEKLGGLQNVFRILGTVIAAFAAVSLAAIAKMKVIAKLKALAEAFKAVDKAMLLARLKVLAIIAVVAILLLVIEDFIQFMRGNDSVIGTLFERAGISADEARAKIIGAWNKTKEFLLNVWDTIKQMAGIFVDAIRGAVEKHADQIRGVFQKAWGVVLQVLKLIWSVISSVAKTVFGGLYDIVTDKNTSAKEKILSVWQTICNALGSVLGAIISVVTAALNIVLTVVSSVLNLVQAFWNRWGDTIIGIVSTAFSIVGAVIETAISVFLTIVDVVGNAIDVFANIADVVGGAVFNAFSSIGDVINNVTGFVSEHKTAMELLGVALGTITALVVAYNAASIAAAIATGAHTLAMGAMGVAAGAAAAAHTVAMGAMSVASGIAAAASGVLTAATGAWTAVAGVAATVTSALGAAFAFLTSPIGLVILAIGALVAVGVVLYNHWSEVKEFAVSTWTSITDFLSGAWEKIKSGAVDTFSNAKETVGNILTGMGNAVSSAWTSVCETVSGALKGIAGFIGSVWNRYGFLRPQRDMEQNHVYMERHLLHHRTVADGVRVFV